MPWDSRRVMECLLSKRSSGGFSGYRARLAQATICRKTKQGNSCLRALGYMVAKRSIPAPRRITRCPGNLSQARECAVSGLATRPIEACNRVPSRHRGGRDVPLFPHAISSRCQSQYRNTRVTGQIINKPVSVPDAGCSFRQNHSRQNIGFMLQHKPRDVNSACPRFCHPASHAVRTELSGSVYRTQTEQLIKKSGQRSCVKPDPAEGHACHGKRVPAASKSESIAWPGRGIPGDG